MKTIAPHNLNKFVGGIFVLFRKTGTNGFEDLGVIRSNKITPLASRGELYDERSGIKELSYTWDKERGLTMEVDTSDLTKGNLQRALMGSTPTAQSQSSATVSAEVFVGYSDKWVRLANRVISAVVIKDSTAVTTYTEGTDYNVDAATGMIRILSTGTIADAASLKAYYTAAVMTGLTYVNIMQSTRFAGDVILKATAENGHIAEMYLPSVEVQPQGDINFTAEDALKIGLKITALKDTTQAAGYEWGTWRELVAGS